MCSCFLGVFSCLIQHIEHSRQDHGLYFQCPVCRNEFQIQDQSLTTEQIANRFPLKIIRKRIQSSSRLLEHKRKPVILDTKAERNNISNKHDFSKPNFHQPKLNNHNVIHKIPSAPCNTPCLREIRVDPPVNMNLSIVNRNPLHVPVINRRFLEPSQFTSMDFHLPNIYSPNAISDTKRRFLEPGQFSSMDFHLTNIYSLNAIPEMNRRFLDPVERYPMDFSLEIYSNSPNTTREINRPFLEPNELHQTNFYLPNITIRNGIPYLITTYIRMLDSDWLIAVIFFYKFRPCIVNLQNFYFM